MISRAAVENYSRLVSLLDADGKRRMSAELAAVDWSNPDAALRECVNITTRYCTQYTEYASVIASQFYETCREAETGIRTFEAIAGSHHDPASDEPAVYGMANSILKNAGEGVTFANDQAALDAFEREVKHRLGASIRSECIETVYSNGRRDPLRPRYARVPVSTGSTYGHNPGQTHNGFLASHGTCAFCDMLASRGFVYWSAESASVGSHTHDGCDCKTVPGFGRNPTVEGYDPSDYEAGYDEYRSQNHEVHDERTRERQRNKWREGYLVAGSGERVDEKDTYTEEERRRVFMQARAQAGDTMRGTKRK